MMLTHLYGARIAFQFVCVFVCIQNQNRRKLLTYSGLDWWFGGEDDRNGLTINGFW